MKLKTSLKFSIDKVEMEEEKEARFNKSIIHAFADGENAHTWPIKTEVLQRCSNTIYDIPILCKYSEYVDDFLGHEEDEIPIGFIKETTNTYDNPIVFEKAEDGRTFIVIKGRIWNKYSTNAIDVLMRDDMKKSVSVEITITDGKEIGGKIDVREFVFEGVTVLGDFVAPAVKDANILLEFSKDKKNYLDGLMENKEIKIDNTKEASVNGSWSNPRRKLFVPIERASNSVSLLKEAYLINEGDYSHPEISKLKYPHHVIRNGKLVVHENGLQAAFKRAKQQGIFSGKIKSHILRHYRELGLSQDNFKTFGIDEKDFNLYFSNLLSEERAGENNMQDKEIDKIYGFEGNTEDVKCEEDVKCTEDVKCEDDSKEDMACKDGMACGEKMEEVKCEDTSEKVDDKVDDIERDKNPDEDVQKDEDKMSYEEAMSKIEEMSKTIETLQSENTSYMSRIEAMSDYEDLKKFKADTLEKEKREEEMAKMNSIMSEIESRGVSMTEDTKKELMAKLCDFTSMDAWANYVKAQVFDNCDNIGHIGFALPYAEKKTESVSVWDRI